MPDDAPPDVDLRPWLADDLWLMERLLGDPAMTAHLGGPESPPQLRTRLERYLVRESGGGRMFVIVAGPTREPAGSVGYWPRDWQGARIWETGWSVLPGFQGRGIASRSTGMCVDVAAGEGRFASMHAFPAVGNAPSNAVCRRVGFELRGEVEIEYPKGHPMLCNDWDLDLRHRPTWPRAGVG